MMKETIKKYRHYSPNFIKIPCQLNKFIKRKALDTHSKTTVQENQLKI